MVGNKVEENVIMETVQEKPTFVFPRKQEMVKEIIDSAKEQHPELNQVNIMNLEQFGSQCIDEIEVLYNAPNILQNPPEDIDVIWIISAPGLLLEQGLKPGWSSNFPWLDNCEREVVGSAFALAGGLLQKDFRNLLIRLQREI